MDPVSRPITRRYSARRSSIVMSRFRFAAGVASSVAWSSVGASVSAAASVAGSSTWIPKRRERLAA